MKNLLLLFIFAIFSFQLVAQDIYQPMSELSDSDLEVIADAKDEIERGDRMVANADSEYQKYSNLFNSSKKSKQKKAEKKTVQAKRNLLSAKAYYNKGYKKLYDLYSEKLSILVFQFPEDQQIADDLKAEAEALFSNGETMLTRNTTYTPKQLKKDVKFKTLQSEVKTGAAKEKEAIEKLAEALNLHDLQAQKQQDYATRDNEAWQNAMMQNSIVGYQAYIDNFPKGLHVYEAQQKIDDLEEKIRIAEQQQSSPELIYHIQIMADNHKWTTQDIKSKVYYTNEQITENYLDGWYKYWIGNYSTYDEAKAAVKIVKQKRKGAFVVGTINGQIVDILSALDAEGN